MGRVVSGCRACWGYVQGGEIFGRERQEARRVNDEQAFRLPFTRVSRETGWSTCRAEGSVGVEWRGELDLGWGSRTLARPKNDFLEGECRATIGQEVREAVHRMDPSRDAPRSSA